MMFFAQTAWSIGMYKYSQPVHLMNQISSLATCIHQQKPRRRECLIKGTFNLNEGPDYPTFLRIGIVPRLRKVQYGRLRVSGGTDYPPFDRNRDIIGDAEGSRYSTKKLEQRTRTPHFHANRYGVDTAERSNPEGRPPIQYTELPAEAQTSHLVWQREKVNDQRPSQQSDEPTLVSSDARDSIGSARSRLPNGGSGSGKRSDSMVQQWHAEKENLGKNNLDARERVELLYMLANICTSVIRDRRGVVGDVARAIGKSMVAPPIDPLHVRRYFGDSKGFRAVDELVRIVTRRGTCTRSSDGRRCRACITARKPPQCQRAFASGLKKTQVAGR